MSATATCHGSHALPWLTLAAVALAAALWAVAGAAPEALVYDRAALADGQWWRWITAHLVHSGGEHALWDIGALAIVGLLLERTATPTRIALATATGILAVDACLWWLLPSLERYCGLSGVLNTLFVLLLAELWRERRDPVVVLAALALPVKIAAELSAARSLFVDMAWRSVPEAHLAGCAGGLLVLGIAAFRRAESSA